CVETPMGMAKKNNPIENFNGQFKQQYTQRRLLRLNTLFEKLLECCSLKSILSITFKTTTRASVETLRAYRKLSAQNSFCITLVPETMINVHSGRLYNVYQRYSRSTLSNKPSEAEEQSAVEHDFEAESQPPIGWFVHPNF
ncbi:hypothetical protein L915_15075, partial [Phytophthora nicotianae]